MCFAERKEAIGVEELPIRFERGLSYASPEGARWFLDHDARTAQVNMAFPHFHPHCELLLLLAPRAAHLVEGRRYELEAGDLVLLAPNVLHQSVYPPGESCDRIVAGFSPPADGFSEAYAALLGLFSSPVPVFRFGREARKNLFDPLNRAAQAARTAPEPVRGLLVESSLTEFLCALWRLRGENRYAPAASDGARSRMYEVTGYIHAHYAEELTAAAIARAFYLSPSYLARRFREETGRTLTEYLQLTRVRNAQALLLSTGESVARIAERTGFGSFSQFNRVFRRVCGKSPRDYRREAAPRQERKRGGNE